MADGGGQRTVQADFQENTRRNLGKGGLGAATGGFNQFLRSLRSIGDTELCSIYSHQPPTSIEGLGMAAAMSRGAQGLAEPVLPQSPGQDRAPLRNRTIAQSPT